VPGLKDSKQFKLSVFLDAGTVWGGAPNDQGPSEYMRYSTGLGVMWYSPFGPLKVILAQPLNDKSGDKTQMLQFQFGSQF
jgi:outer membrane protein insertion porin family